MFSNLDDINLLISLPLAVVLLLIGIAYAATNKMPGNSFAIKIFTVAFLVRVISVFAIYYYLVSVGGDGYVIRDDRAYNETALEIARDLRNNRDGFKEVGGGYKNVAYFNLNGFLYHYLSFDTLSSRILNSFFGSIVVLLGFYIMLQLFDGRIAKITAIMMAFLPNMIFWSASQVKDPLIILSTMSLIYIMVCKFRTGINIFVVLSYTFFMYLLWHLRKDFCFPLIAVAVVWALFKYTVLGRYFNNPKRATFMKMGIMSVLALPLLVGLLFTSSGTDFVGTINKFNDMQEGLSQEGTDVGLSRYLRVVSPADVYKLPAAMAFTAIAPLPNFNKPKDPKKYGAKIFSIINISLVLLLPYVAVGFLRFRSPNMMFTDELLIKWLPLLTWVSISIIYMGVFRYKASLLTYFLMWAAVGWRYRKAYNKHLLFMYMGGAVSIFVLLPILLLFR